MTLRDAQLLSMVERLRRRAEAAAREPEIRYHRDCIRQEIIPDLLAVLDQYEPTIPPSLAETPAKA